MSFRTRPAALLAVMALTAAALVATPSTASAATGTLSVSPTRVIGGERVVVTGKTGHRDKRTVVLQRRAGTKWVRVTSGRTNSKGSFRLTYKTRAAAAGRTTLRVHAPKFVTKTKTKKRKKVAARTTPSRSLSVVTQTAAVSAPSTLTAGATFTATGTFSPARPGRQTRLERWDGRTWVAIASGPQDRHGRVAYRAQLGQSGTHLLQTVASAAGGAPAATSSGRTVDVRPAVVSPPTDPVDPPTEPVDPPVQPAKTWTTVGENPYPAEYAAIATLRDGRVLMAGGRLPNGAVTARAQLFDPSAATFAPAAAAPTARLLATAVTLKDGRVAVFAGRTTSSVSSPVLRDVDIYDPDTDSWTTSLRPDIGFDYASSEPAASLEDGRVLVVFNTSQGPRRAFLFDPSRSTWTPALAGTDPGSDEEPRIFSSMTKLADGRVMVIDGYTRTGESASPVEMFDPRTDSWTSASPLPQTRLNHSTLLLRNGDVLVRGGRWFEPYHNAPPTHSLLYSPSTDTWKQLGTDGYKLDPRLAQLPDGSVFATGGGAVKVEQRAETVRINVTTGVVEPLPAMPSDLSGAHLVVRPDGSVIAVASDKTPVLRFG